MKVGIIELVPFLTHTVLLIYSSILLIPTLIFNPLISFSKHGSGVERMFSQIAIVLVIDHSVNISHLGAGYVTLSAFLYEIF